MPKIYLACAAIAIVIGAYFFGIARGRDICTYEIATHAATISQQQNNTKEKINAEILRTSTDDIRDILRTKYTIAD
ncbi:MAG: hypothetical protein IKP24_00710 [Alphaproteobacteria bacterium]|nr:hypothetical protein [Alphaproteobacteria bacterium]